MIEVRRRARCSHLAAEPGDRVGHHRPAAVDLLEVLLGEVAELAARVGEVLALGHLVGGEDRHGEAAAGRRAAGGCRAWATPTPAATARRSSPGTPSASSRRGSMPSWVAATTCTPFIICPRQRLTSRSITWLPPSVGPGPGGGGLRRSGRQSASVSAVDCAATSSHAVGRPMPVAGALAERGHVQPGIAADDEGPEVQRPRQRRAAGPAGV